MIFLGDRVIIYMPLIPEAVMAMLATVRIGAIHSVVFGGKWKKTQKKIIKNSCKKMRTQEQQSITFPKLLSYRYLLPNQ